MKYNIITIDDSRIVYKRNIKRKAKGIDQVVIPATNGSNVDLGHELAQRDLRETSWSAKVGELGCWLSHFDCWQWAADNEELLVFEDDAIIDWDFVGNLEILKEQLPQDYDFFSLWVPDNQRQDYFYLVQYDDNGIPVISGRIENAEDSYFNIGSKHISRAYQGYGLVATMYSSKGGAALVERARHRGITGPVDCFIFEESHAERVKGYAPKPHITVVSYDWSAKTTIHDTGVKGAI